MQIGPHFLFNENEDKEFCQELHGGIYRKKNYIHHLYLKQQYRKYSHFSSRVTVAKNKMPLFFLWSKKKKQQVYIGVKIQQAI